MPEKRILTSEFVDNAQPPEKGERWIADTKIKKFGLRLWATKSGGSKAYCVRLGSGIRLTYQMEHLSYHKILRSPSLGDCLPEAREWAAEQIKEALQKEWPDEYRDRYEDRVFREHIAEKIGRLTLQEAADIMLKRFFYLGHTEGYRDQINLLFDRWDAESLKNTQLSQLDVDKLAKALVIKSDQHGNAKALRLFINQIVRQAQEFGAPLVFYDSELNWKTLELRRVDQHVDYPELLSLNQDDYEKLYKQLDLFNEQWQQVYCIRIYLTLETPFYRLKSAKWNQFHKGFWYPYSPDERYFWYEARQIIREETTILLKRLARITWEKGIKSEYLFPSQFKCYTQHISSVNNVWKKALKALGFRNIPLRIFAMTLREQKTLSDRPYCIRRIDRSMRRQENMAILSMNLIKKRKNEIFSNCYLDNNLDEQNINDCV